MKTSTHTAKPSLFNKPLIRLAISLGLPNAIGGISSVFTVSSVRTWYVDLAKPWFTPPGWVFGPVWTLLYLMMGAAFFLVWNKAEEKREFFPCWFFIAHLFVNGLWSFLFFYWQSPGLAFLDIVVLWGMISLLVAMFWKISRTASWLMVPYWLWVSFAAVLNYAIWKMNP